MIRHGGILGISLLCALVCGAIAAPGASAITGTTAFTCVNEGGSSHAFAGEHCKPGEGEGAYSHVAFAQDTETQITVTNEKTNATTDGPTNFTIHAVASGLELEVVGTGVHGEGTLYNRKKLNGEHFVDDVFSVGISGLSVGKPAGKGCKVSKESINTEPLKSTTAEQGDFIKFEPESGETIATFTIEGCSVAALNHLYSLKGSVKWTPDGATLLLTRSGTTAQGTLTLSGQKAGIDGKLTLKGRHWASFFSYTPLAFTTEAT